MSMDKELVITMYCRECRQDKGAVYGVATGNSGVRHNVTEPAEMEGATQCPDCGTPLEVKRYG